MSDYNDNIGDIDEPDDAWSNLPESFGLWRHRPIGDISEQLAQQVEGLDN